MNNSDDYYVYVRDHKADVVDIVAFRDKVKNEWYDKNGKQVTDPAIIAKEEGLVQLDPFLKTSPKQSDITKVHHGAFASYTPTFSNGGITLSPRIAFSFAVGDRSKFWASYNVITKWSSATQRFLPTYYLFFEKFANEGAAFSNPGLKPERAVNYEIGFNQMIGGNMSMEFGAYYSERKDMVVLYQYSQAYPQTYISYTNMDFGTVQGFSFGLNKRPGKGERASFNANYTLQFAKGTGSDPNSTINLIRSGQPNLRTLTTLESDQRHKINFGVTYAFQPEDAKIQVVNKKANTKKEYQWLKNVTARIEMRVGSGFPYTRSSTPFSTIAGQGTRVVEGAINGSRMPWTIMGDFVVRKNFDLVLKKDEKGDPKRRGGLEVGLAIYNILGYKNITSVYTYTGSRMDDGFLTAKDFQQYINNQENPASYIDYYTIRMEGTNPYGSPRTFELQLSFQW
jgi:outer membrane receptor protein involved in Fe transport